MFGKRRTSISSNVSSRSTASQASSPPAPQLNLSVSVFARVRPSIPLDSPSGVLQDSGREDDLTQNTPLLQTFPEENAIIVARSHADSSPQRFILDGIFPGSASQREIHRRTGTLDAVEQVLNGSNAVVLVYGQTGSGKTFTVFGPPSSGGLEAVGARDASLLGLLPRALHDVFEKSEVKRSQTISGSLKIDVSIRYLQLYNDTWIDLLDVSGVDRGGGDRTASINADAKLTPSSASLHPCADVRIALQLLHRGDRRKVVAATSMNSTSSRGHTFFQIVLCQEEKQMSSTLSSSPSITTTTLSFLDLAGSERISKSNAEGLQLTEAKSINKSLHGLSICLSAVASSILKQQQHVVSMGSHFNSSESSSSSSFIPWRTSKLTRFLQSCLAEPLIPSSPSSPSICRKCLLGLIVCVSPSNLSAYESLSTLAFASRARAVTEALAGDFSSARAALSDTTYIVGTSRLRRNPSSGANSEVDLYSSRPPSNDGSDAETEDDNSISSRGGEGGGGEILGKVLDQQRTQIGSLTLSYETLLAANKQLQMKLDAAEAEAKKLREIKEKIEASNSNNSLAPSVPVDNTVAVKVVPTIPVDTEITTSAKDVPSSDQPVVQESSATVAESTLTTPPADVEPESSALSLNQATKQSESTDLEALLASALASGDLETLRSAVEQVAASAVRPGAVEATPKPQRNSTLSLEELSTLPMTPMLSLPTPTANAQSSLSADTHNTDDQPAAGARSTSRSRPSHDNEWKNSLRGSSNSSSPFRKGSLPPPSPSRTSQTLLQLAGMKSPLRSVSASKSRSSSSGPFSLSSSKKSQSPAAALSHYLTSSSPMPPSLEMFLSPMPPQSSHALNSAPSPSEEVFSLAAKGGMKKQLSEARSFSANDLLKSPEGIDEPSDLLDIPLSPEERSSFVSPTAVTPTGVSPPPPPPPPGNSLRNKNAPVAPIGLSSTNHRPSKSILVPFAPVNVPITNASSGGSSNGDPGVAIAAVQAALNRAQNVLTRLQNQQHGLHLPSHQHRLQQGPAPPPPPPSLAQKQVDMSHPQQEKVHDNVLLQTIPQGLEEEGEEIEQEEETSKVECNIEKPNVPSVVTDECVKETTTEESSVEVGDIIPAKRVEEEAIIVYEEASMVPINNKEVPITSVTDVLNEKSSLIDKVNNSHALPDSISSSSSSPPPPQIQQLQSELDNDKEASTIDIHQTSTNVFNTQEVRMVAAEVAGTLAAKALEAMQAQIEKQQEQLVALQIQQERMLEEREKAIAERIVALEQQVNPVLRTTQSITVEPVLKGGDNKLAKNHAEYNLLPKNEDEINLEHSEDNEDDLAPVLSGAMTLTAAAEAAVSAVNLSSSLSRSRRSSFGGSSDLSAGTNSSIDVVSALQNARAALARALSAVSDAGDDDDDVGDLYLPQTNSATETSIPITMTVVPSSPHHHHSSSSSISSSATVSDNSANFILEAHSTPSIQETLPAQQSKPLQAAGVAGTNVVRALQGQRTPLFDSQLLGGKQSPATSSVTSTITTTTQAQPIYISASSASSNANKAAAEAVAAAAAVALSRENAQRENDQYHYRNRVVDQPQSHVSPLVYNTIVSHQQNQALQNVLTTPPPMRASRDSENRNSASSTATTVKSATPVDSDTVTVFVPGQGIVVMSKAKLAAMHVPVDTSKRAHIDDRGNVNVTVNHSDESLTENVFHPIDEVPRTHRPDLRSADPPQSLVSKRFGANH